MATLRSLGLFSLVLGLILGWSAPLGAQAPSPPPQDEPRTTPLPEDPVPGPAMAAGYQQPELDAETPVPPTPLPAAMPETTVVGRPGAFPSQPLGPEAAISPTLTPTLTSEVGSSLTVITSEQIGQSQKTNVSDVLRDVPGLDVVQQGPAGSLTSVFMRGANSQGTKVLLDGIPMNDPSNATRMFDFSGLDVENIERIEVLRGPQSMLFGSDAMGGVINIVTKRGQGPATLSAGVLGGTYGTARETVNVSGGGQRGYYSLGAAYLQSDGFSAADRRNGNTEADGTRNTTVSGRFGLTPSRDLDVDYVFRYIDQNTMIDQYDFALGRPVDQLYRNNLTEAFFNRVQARAMTLDGLWEHKVGFSLADYHRRDTLPGPWDVPEFIGQTRKFDYQGNFYLGEWNTFTVGADYMAEESQTSVEPEQTDPGVWFQDQVRIAERWFTTFGYRWDDYSLAGPAETYRVTTLYRLPGPKTAFHGSIGTAFRAPSLAELDYAPPTGLRPEQSRGWDCGIEQPFGDGQFVVDCTYFRNDFTDLIQFDYTTFLLENIGSALSSGTELTANWKLNECTTFFGSYVYTFTEDLETGLPLLRRAPHKARLGVNRAVWCGRGNIQLDCIYVSPRDDTTSSTPSGRTVLPEYWLVNLAGTYKLNPHLQLVARIDNLLDTQYEEIFGYGTAGISFYGGVNGWW